MPDAVLLDLQILQQPGFEPAAVQTRWPRGLISLPGASATVSAYKAENGFSITVAARDIQGFAEYISFESTKQEERLGAGRGLSTEMGDLRMKT